MKGYTRRTKSGKLVRVRAHNRVGRGVARLSGIQTGRPAVSLGGLRHSGPASPASRTRVVSASKARKSSGTTGKRHKTAGVLAGPEFRGDPNNDRHVIDFYKKLGMGELRKRQDLTTQQIGHAYKQRNTKALEHLQRQEKLLTHAVYEKNFG